MADSLSVHAIIPLSLLEAIRNLDTPVEDGLEELAGEMVSKRLGLSPTVAAQIARYQDTARKDGKVSVEEATSEGAVSLPAADGVRDALTAFYYVRSLDLQVGRTVSLPVNDGGRNMVVSESDPAVSAAAPAKVA